MYQITDPTVAIGFLFAATVAVIINAYIIYEFVMLIGRVREYLKQNKQNNFHRGVQYAKKQLKAHPDSSEQLMSNAYPFETNFDKGVALAVDLHNDSLSCEKGEL
jgi:hypothetical protein